MKRWIGYSTITSLLLAVAYEVLLRYLSQSEPLSSVMVTLSFAFLVLGLLAMGALAVWFAPLSIRRDWGAVLRIGALACLLWLLIVLLLAWEVLICIAMAFPIVLPMTLLGSALVCLLARRQASHSQFQSSLLLLLLAAPYLAGPVEQRFPLLQPSNLWKPPPSLPPTRPPSGPILFGCRRFCLMNGRSVCTTLLVFPGRRRRQW